MRRPAPFLLIGVLCLSWVSLIVFDLTTNGKALAEEIDLKIPRFINPNTAAPSVGTTTIRTVRFLTTDDFPPFSFVDPQGRLEGFNIGLARQLCLEIKARCTMQALPWDELDAAVDSGQGDAIMAGLRMTDETLRRYGFSRSYLRFPARFFSRTDKAAGFDAELTAENFKVGVESETAHAAYLSDFFKNAEIKTYDNQQQLRDALKVGDVDFGFADGVATSFWLQSQNAQDCCELVGEAYLSTEYFGPGLTIAVPIDRQDLKQALDDGLRRLMRNGKYAEIYLQYFPINFF